MIKNRNFYVTYKKKNSELVTRLGTLKETCKGFFETKKNEVCFNYWDIKAEGFRTATGAITMRYV